MKMLQNNPYSLRLLHWGPRSFRAILAQVTFKLQLVAGMSHVQLHAKAQCPRKYVPLKDYSGKLNWQLESAF